MARPPRLPLFGSLAGAWRLAWSAKRDLAVLAGVLTAVSVAIDLLPLPHTCGQILGQDLATALVIDLPRQLAGPGSVARADAISGVICVFVGALPAALVTLLLNTVLAVAWHRRVLLPGQKQSFWTVYGWDWRKMKVALAALLLALPAIVYILATSIVFGTDLMPDIVQATVGAALQALLDGPEPWRMPLAVILLPGLSGALLLFVAAATTGRFLLVFPALATDRGGHPGRSWRWTRGNYWRLVWLVLLAPLPFYAARHGLLYSIRPIEGDAISLAVSIATTALGFLGLAAGVTALSLAYQEIRDALYERAAGGSGAPGGLRLRAGRTT